MDPRRLACIVAASICVACGSSPSDGLPDPTPQVEDPPPLSYGELVIAVQPVEEMEWLGVWEVDGDIVRGAGTIELALGDEYPALEVVLDQGSTTNLVCRGTFDVDAATSTNGGVEVDASRPNAWRIEPRAEGTFEVVASGTFTPEDPSLCAQHPDGVAFELDVTVVVRAPASVQLDLPLACSGTDRPILVSGGQLQSWQTTQRPVLLAADGTPFHPRNASADRPATITIRASADTGLGLVDPEGSFYALMAVGSRDIVRVSAFDREVVAFELLDAAAIDDVDMALALMGGKVGGGIELEPGQHYGASGWPVAPELPPWRSIAALALAQYVDGDPTCTLARADAFTIRSSTASVCRAYAESGHGLSVPEIVAHQAELDVSAELLASGTCALVLDAPTFAGGEGWSTSISVQLSNVEDLVSTPTGR